MRLLLIGSLTIFFVLIACPTQAYIDMVFCEGYSNPNHINANGDYTISSQASDAFVSLYAKNSTSGQQAWSTGGYSGGGSSWSQTADPIDSGYYECWARIWYMLDGNPMAEESSPHWDDVHVP